MTVPSLKGLDAHSPTPLYHQIYLDFRHRILLGILPFGQKLPSEMLIAEELGVSRITAKRAMNELAEEGLVTRNRGRGTTVAFRQREQRNKEGFAGLIENLQNIAATTTIDVLSFDYIKPPEQIAEQMELSHSDLTQRVERRRSRDGEPFSHILSYVPESIGRAWDKDSLSTHPILKLIEDAGHRIASARQRIISEAASPRVAQILKLPAGAPLLKVSRLVRDEADTPIEYVDVLYRPDMYHFEMDLHRSQDDDGRQVWSPVK